MIEIILKYLKTGTQPPYNNSVIINLIEEVSTIFNISESDTLLILNKYTNLPTQMVNMYYSGQEWYRGLHIAYNHKGNPSPAEQWLMKYLSEPFDVRFNEGYMTYYRGDQWIFQQELKNKYFWCYYSDVWKVFETEFGLKQGQVKDLYDDILLTPVNCEGFTTHEMHMSKVNKWLTPVNCEGFTPLGSFLSEAIFLTTD